MVTEGRLWCAIATAADPSLRCCPSLQGGPCACQRWPARAAHYRTENAHKKRRNESVIQQSHSPSLWISDLSRRKKERAVLVCVGGEPACDSYSRSAPAHVRPSRSWCMCIPLKSALRPVPRPAAAAPPSRPSSIPARRATRKQQRKGPMQSISSLLSFFPSFCAFFEPFPGLWEGEREA